jgi:hypothetical protein
MSADRSQPKEVSGLSKIEAEDLLDCLEATGHEPGELAFVDGEGFKVRPEAARAPTDADRAENKSSQGPTESVGSLSASR